jgi:hypothetical protein
MMRYQIAVVLGVPLDRLGDGAVLCFWFPSIQGSMAENRDLNNRNPISG